MSAFTASFLANPFEDQALGQTTDSLGNIFNANGQHVGVVPGSVADIGSKGAVVPPTSTSSSPASATTNDVLSTSTAAGVPYGGQLPTAKGMWAKLLKVASDATGISEVENMIFIAVGLILVAGGVFSFRPARDVIVGVAKGAMAA